MDRNTEAYYELQSLIEDWASAFSELVKYPHILARHTADYVFEELLQISLDGTNQK